SRTIQTTHFSAMVWQWSSSVKGPTNLPGVISRTCSRLAWSMFQLTSRPVRPWFALGAITRRGTSIGMALPWPNARETPMQRGKCKDSLKIYDVGARHSVPPTSPPCQFFSTPWQTGQHHKANQISHLRCAGHQFATFLRQLVPRLPFLSPTLLFLSKP